MNDQLFPVPFHGDTVVLASHNNEPYVVMKPVCANMGADWPAQHAKLKKNFKSTMAIIAMVAEDGKLRDMVALHLRKFPAWLYSVDKNRVAPELREKVIRYQDECDEVLWRYWTEGYAARPGARVPTVSQQLAAHGVRSRLLKDLKRETDPASRRAIHDQLAHASRLLGLETPAIESIGREALPDHESPLLEEFWEVVDALQQAGQAMNHARGDGLLALNLPQVRGAAAAARLALPDTLELRRLLRACRSPRFVAVKAVNSAIDTTTVKCWVFERPNAGGQRSDD